MNETWTEGVARRWRNITNALRDIDDYTDEDGIRYTSHDLDTHPEPRD